MRTRSIELDMAERHYVAAIQVLTPPSEPKKLDGIQEFQSPTSSTSSGRPNSFGRRPSAASFDSQHSVASSETSYAEDEDFFADWESKRSSRVEPSLLPPTFQDGQSLSRRPSQRKRPSPIITNSRQSYYKEQFSADLYAFTCMVELHLASLRELRETIIPDLRSSFFRPRASTIGSRPIRRDPSIHGDGAAIESVRQRRRTMTFRPRFNPSSVRELCQEALADL